MDKNTEQNDLEKMLSDALADLRRSAPPGFTGRVMTALPAKPDRAYPRLLTLKRAWGTKVLAAAAALMIAFGGGILLFYNGINERTLVKFEFHDPGAVSVELVGDFTSWQSGRIQLDGPNKSGLWTAAIELPEGRHEYIFLVNGQKWVTDPYALVRRPDGFGNQNAVLNL